MTDRDLETGDGLQAVADRHGVGLDAVRHLLQALEAGNGTMAQFNHPDLGGFGQWSAGGMIMIGQMFDQNLKNRVAALCSELAGSLPPGGWSSVSSGGWWPDGLGRPATSGAQNGLRYAYFPQSRRLAIESGDVLALYDTGEYDISGVSQQQGGSQSLRFSGRGGSVDLDQLKRVDDGQDVPPAPHEPAPWQPEAASQLRPAETQRPPAASPAPVSASTRSTASEVLATLEKVAELHGKGVLTDAEFAAKKAELLARL
ncbi:MAG: SHOCT domain-containing protein [Methylobacterium sp.]|uniref:SHOCT domain-containing protein n=1 Tax=Methylobacterium sp. TaxID=409 RepID=UPI0025D45285|nr:SHOCT domain-containing protein [Methylobacterium sp.]MBX9931885.1 SHOCT domain-containing protein [Methylobacterium sp.]